MTRPTVMLDCRWLSINGAGRLTELLLQGFRRRPPRQRWLLWGPEETRALAWPGAEVVVTDRDPRAGFGQRCWFEVPRSDLAVFLHQQRPMRRLPSITVILDTIPLRFARHRATLMAKRQFLRRVARTSRQVVTISRYSQACIDRDLGHPAGRVAVLSLPVDEDFADRVQQLRAEVAAEDAALYVGAFLPHKNLDRLVAAFERTDFRSRGGLLWLVGGAADHLEELSARLTPGQREFVELQGRCSQDELERRFAAATLLVQPSLEEGFGLPVWEAISCGLPVCVSDGGALPEIVAGVAEPFPATSVEAMAAAIDACAAAGTARPSGPIHPAGATVEQFAAQFEEIVCANLA